MSVYMETDPKPYEDISTVELIRIRGGVCEGGRILPGHICANPLESFQIHHAMFPAKKRWPQLNVLMNYLLIRSSCNTSKMFDNLKSRRAFMELQKRRHGYQVDAWIAGLHKAGMIVKPLVPLGDIHS